MGLRHYQHVPLEIDFFFQNSELHNFNIRKYACHKLNLGPYEALKHSEQIFDFPMAFTTLSYRVGSGWEGDYAPLGWGGY